MMEMGQGQGMMGAGMTQGGMMGCRNSNLQAVTILVTSDGGSFSIPSTRRPPWVSWEFSPSSSDSCQAVERKSVLEGETGF
jgi:hypothetical protein